MKKLMILAAVVCAAIASQASTFNWKSYTGQQVYLQNTTDRAASMTAVLFNADTYSQTDVVNAFTSGSFDSLAKLSTITTETTGAIKNTVAGNEFSWGSTGDTLNAFFAIVVDDDIFVSTLASAEGQASAASTLTFKDFKTASQSVATEWTSGMTASAGWYTAAVPEPTSGLLMLLGMAGLALRRRRA